MTGFNGQILSYDAHGNLTSDGTNSYSWDARNHLSGISGGVTASFIYDPFGRRSSKTIGGTTTQFLYDGLNPLQELDGALPPNVTANLLTGLGIDEYFSRSDSSGPMNFLSDALGSTLGLSNSSGALATSYTYDPFGNVSTSGAANVNPYQFTGRENDATGLYFNRARYHSPTYQRFIAQDPVGFGGGDPNFYAYAFNDPLSYVDPSGFDAIYWFNDARGTREWWWDGPTNGNYGGENWTSGLGPGQAGPPAPPSSSADMCYAAHDQCFDSCTSPQGSCHGKGACNQCNQNLVTCLQSLPDDPHKWPLPPDPTDDPGDFGARYYRLGAIFTFQNGLW
ncbi:MAG: RHS repeat-associated core domain-containing protein [Candidatus Binataceae bacterium]